MSRNDETTGKIVDVDFSALDQELAAMAAETPEVPADFHDKWTQADREDAKNNPREDTPAETEQTEDRKTVARRQRRYILSAAAAFVLIIGVASLLNFDKLQEFFKDNPFNRIKTASVQENREDTVPTTQPETQGKTESTSTQETEQEETGEGLREDLDGGGILSMGISDDDAEEAPGPVMNQAYTGGSANEASHPAPEEESCDAEAAEEAYAETYAEDAFFDAEEYEPDMSQALLSIPVQASGASLADSIDGAAADKAAKNETDRTADSEPEAVQAKKEPAPEAMPEPTPAKTPEITPEPTPRMTPETTPEPVPAPTVIPETGEEAVSGEISAEAAAPEKREETAEEQSPSFLQRVWDFLLRITPWALGAAVIVLFLVTYAIRAKQRKGK